MDTSRLSIDVIGGAGHTAVVLSLLRLLGKVDIEHCLQTRCDKYPTRSVGACFADSRLSEPSTSASKLFTVVAIANEEC